MYLLPLHLSSYLLLVSCLLICVLTFRDLDGFRASIMNIETDSIVES